MSIIYTSKSQAEELKHFVETKSKSDIVGFYHHENRTYRKANKEEWSGQLKAFRQYRKEAKLTINIRNHRDPMIQGKQFYILVVQSLDESGKIQGNIDPMGLAFDTGSFLVSGLIYAFTNKDNRDKSYKYIMGIKA